MADSMAAWCRGFVAGRDGVVVTVNPHPVGSALADDWHDGWCEGTRRRLWPVAGEEDGIKEPPMLH